MPQISDNALDALLQYIIDNAEDLHICSADPTSFANVAVVTLGDKNGISLGAVGDRTPNGRKTTVAAITDGDITGTDDATHWAIVDQAGSELLASGALSASQAVTSGNTFSLAAFDVGVPDAV